MIFLSRVPVRFNLSTAGLAVFGLASFAECILGALVFGRRAWAWAFTMLRMVLYDGPCKFVLNPGPRCRCAALHGPPCPTLLCAAGSTHKLAESRLRIAEP